MRTGPSTLERHQQALGDGIHHLLYRLGDLNTFYFN